MKQYCRYCTYMVCGDFNYCEIKKKFFLKSTIKSINHCKDFEFNPMDALQENKNEYKPREKDEKIEGQQLTLI